ncbi:MAG: hypothetical protein DMF69_15940 [Acidobacteria bacterium]|nr:MAG: hypothetical protein DMF69_15940 [Acidobacteriota bacterium]
MLELVVRLAQVGIEDQPPPHQENPLCLSHDKLKHIDFQRAELAGHTVPNRAPGVGIAHTDFRSR